MGPVDKSVLNDATKLYAKLVAGGKAGRYDPAKGYIILKLFRSKPEDGSTPSLTPDDSTIAGNGSGFVIGDGYILTNYHVVDDAAGLLLQDPANPAGDPLPGKVVAFSKPLDLAIVRCNALLAPPVPLSSAPPARGAEVLAGHPI